ncbi:cytochrome P450 [Aspergillus brunneoviolaceus CBS 621.78]|uniref:Cytochrome P450 n=1 Tax=Aspergillus brunneoviolaceus CBS 621.78 TaxID=1450534 RepID=A0ACD1FW84_9EURO|nr:cytochrome P450 [Aspergillus brunneoviolaceus CBS 621.78]RAH41207.1 cytochrome P450 [Aspergillus brunneoviolaceus CBS 621.78]
MEFDLGRNLSAPAPGIVPIADSRSYTVTLAALWIPIFIAISLLWYGRLESPLAHVPLVSTGKSSFWDIGHKKAKESFAANARKIVAKGFQQVGNTKPFRVISDLGEMLVLPPSMADQVRNIDALSHGEFMKESTCAEVHGFEPFFESTGHSLLADMTKTKLMGSLKQLTDPVNETATQACKDLFPDDDDWHEVVLKDILLEIIARMSSTIFLGDEEVRHDKAWLRLTKEYTVDSFLAAHQLRTYPQFLWPVLAMLFPQARKVRDQLRQAEAIIRPLIERRRAEKAAALADPSIKLPERYDSIEWLEQTSQDRKIPYAPVAMQLTLALSAIHTTTDLITTTMYELLRCPEVIRHLRKEVVSVMGSGGIKHSALYNLKLMDSVIKEAQRIKPALSINMVRKATANITLPDGFRIPKGTMLGVSHHGAWDSAVFPEADKFDAFRFVRLREQPGNENRWQLTTLRSEHIAFGHGLHACPGRFLAANEIKIALCHLLMKFEWKVAGEVKPRIIENGIFLDSDPGVRVLVRRRKGEVEV